MRVLTPVIALSLLLTFGMVTHPAAQLVPPRPITYSEAQLLVLDSSPVLQAFARGVAPIIGPPARLTAQPADRGIFTIHVSTPSQQPLGTYRVVAATARVYDAATGQELRNAEIEAAENILRNSHGIVLATPAAMRR